MKTVKLSLLSFVFLIVASNQNILAQCTTPWCTTGNALGGSGEVLGSVSGNFALNISNAATTQPINFWTNGTQKATILSGGNVGIGIATPVSVLHLDRSSAAQVTTRYTNTNTSNGSTDGFEVGINAAGTGILHHWMPARIEVLTNNQLRASFTSDDGSGNYTFGSSGSPNTEGEGLRIHDPNDNGGDLDLWTSNSNQSHIVWGTGGRIQAINYRFEIQADFDEGLWFNVADAGTGTFFNQVGQETGRIGSNTFWRIGENTTNANADRRLEVIDGTDPQLRLTNSLTGPVRTDFQTTAAGHLLINPFNNAASTNVGINMSTAPFAKLQVANTTSLVGELVTTNGTGHTLHLGVAAQSAGASQVNVGLLGQTSTVAFPTVASAVLFPIGAPNPNPTSVTNYNAGVIGWGAGNTFNFGGVFEANDCPAALSNIGVYASARRPGCGFAGRAGYFQGSVYATGAVMVTSDMNLKDSIGSINNALSIVQSLKPKQFYFKTDSFPYMNLESGKHYGLIAQQVDTVLPELVREVIQPLISDTSNAILQDTMTYKSINYIELIPLTIRAIQELDSLKVTAATTKADSNHVVKWSIVDKTLVNSLIYDDGTKIGIPATATNVYVNAVNTGNSITAGKFEGGSKGLHGIASGTNASQIGVLGECSNAATMNVGVKGEAKRATSAYNIGMQGYADSSGIANVGVVASTIYNNNTSVNIGIYGDAKNSQFQNIAGQFLATDTIGLCYGVYASALDTADYAGYFSGDVHVTGAFTRTSDAKLKNNIQNFSADTSLAWLGQLEPKTYQYRRADYPSLTLPAGTQYGFVAQDVEKVLPQLVKDVTHPEIRDLNGNLISHRMEYKSVDYLGFVPLLVGALQAQESKIETQQQKIDSLSEVITERLTAIENRLNGCCGTGAAFKNDESETTVNRINVELNSMQVIVLEQNVPNPFAEQTSVSYFVPENMETAQIVFADMLGNVIKTVDIKPGYGVMTVFASNLSTGQYSYTLLVDGKIAETKKMMKGK